jgi:dihydrodipicolinate reductase
VVLDVKLDKGDDLNAVLDQFEVLIDFTRPEATLDYLATCLSANKAMVISGFMMIVPIYAKVSNNKSSLPRY